MAIEIMIPEGEYKAIREELKKLRIFRNQVLKAIGSIEGLPDGHAYQIIWYEDEDIEEGDDKPCGIITVGMIKRAIV